jgi:2-dehydro-3-deoxyphosphogluconate aldolase/(4S)-4-hydroxy-2-oxoglutarate aldolase
MNPIIETISKNGIIPVVKFGKADDAVPTARALSEGGLECIEVTFRTDCAGEAIKQITDEFPEVLVGAGTVLTKRQVDQATSSGASFIVSPGFNPSIVEYCQEQNIPVIPGCSGPSDIERALDLGLSTVKLFPAEVIGGINMVKALSGPYPQMTYIPTGGINEGNLASYLGNSKVIACGGSWMMKDEYIAKSEYDKITAASKAAVDIMLGFEFGHMGINGKDPADADGIASFFNRVFAFVNSVGNSSIISSQSVEITKEPLLGEKGHIGIKTNSIPRAMHYLRKKGVAFDEPTAKYDGKGMIKAIYLQGEIGGFAVHLIQK